MDLQPTSDYIIGRMCGGENPYDNQQHLIEQGLIPNPMYHTRPHNVAPLGAPPTATHMTYSTLQSYPIPPIDYSPMSYYSNGHHPEERNGHFPVQEMPMALTTAKTCEKLTAPKVSTDRPQQLNGHKTERQIKRSLSEETEGTCSPPGSAVVEETEKNETFRETPQPKKRGRPKKIVDPNALAKLEEAQKADAARRPAREKPYDPWADLKASGKPFVQDGPCFGLLDVSSKRFAKCISCRLMSDENNECRFNEFRKLRFVGDMVQAEGFTDSTDASESDSKVWTANHSEEQKFGRDLKTARMVLTNVGDILCQLVTEELKVIEEFGHLLPESDAIKWKRVYGVREMCDVCSTTIFNFHWTCGQCGFVTCTDCFRARIEMKILTTNRDPNKDEYRWMFCGNPKTMRSHEPRKLLLTEIIPKSLLVKMNDEQHRIRKRERIPMMCPCIKKVDPKVANEQKKLIVTRRCANNNLRAHLSSLNTKQTSHGRSFQASTNLQSLQNGSDQTSSLDFLADIAMRQQNIPPINLNHSVDIADAMSSTAAWNSTILETIEQVLEANNCIHRLPVSSSRQQVLALRVSQKYESRLQYRAPHKWLCKGKLLLLLEATNPQNVHLFQEQWNRGQPIVVAHVSKVLDMNLWHPDAFLRDFGEQRSSLVDCRTGSDLGKLLPMKKFWEGFECFGKRMKDRDGEHMLLKLKDWPPDQNFSEVLPHRYRDLMRALPLPMYTLREGSHNLANRLPDCFVPPDLGPKMYNAYGSALFPSKGTTNLHLDMSDAANVMVYVGIPRDGDCHLHIEEALKAVEEAGCDAIQMKRVREKDARVGAVWHIFNAQDAEAIRHLLRKVTVEKGNRVETNSDPIHDQLWYLDRELRKRLWKEYGVEGYAIAQCLGDTVFIPAGAPHQVRNLHSCIKVAEDFVSPENLAHCLRLTNEFRFLSDSHTNHEDKLQVKNVVFHAVKDAVSVLSGKAAGFYARENLET